MCPCSLPAWIGSQVAQRAPDRGRPVWSIWGDFALGSWLPLELSPLGERGACGACQSAHAFGLRLSVFLEWSMIITQGPACRREGDPRRRPCLKVPNPSNAYTRIEPPSIQYRLQSPPVCLGLNWSTLVILQKAPRRGTFWPLSLCRSRWLS